MNAPAVIGKQGTLALPGAVTATSLVLPAKLSFEEWEAAGQVLRQVERSCMWWIGDWWAFGDHKYGERAAQATEGAAFQTMADAGWVSRKFETSRRREVLSWSHHREVAALKPAEADKLLDAAEAENMTRAELRRSVHRLRKTTEAGAFPAPGYRVIYADPPWNYGDKLVEGYGAAEHHYTSMTIEQLCALEIAPLALSDAVLFMWATSPLLQECFAVIEAWGFEYKSSFVWDKVKHNMGHYNSVRHELLLVCTRGSCTPDVPTLIDSVQTIERSAKHSEKPDEFRAIIDTLYPNGKRIELFSRSQHEGWDAWGNEAAA